MSVPQSGARLPWWLAIPVLAAYANSFDGSFQFDDFNVIVDNPAVHSVAAWWQDLGHGIRPLLKLSYALNWQFGQSVASFHAVNAAIHLANAFLVYALVRCIAAGYGDRVAGVAPVAGITAALLFALHPAATEAVTYVSGRSASLMAAFYLAACLAYVARQRLDSTARGGWLPPALFALALASKESAVSLPCVLLLWEASRRQRFEWRGVGARLWPHLVVLGLGVAAFAVHPLYGHRLGVDLHPAATFRHALTDIDGLCYLLGRWVGLAPANIDPDLRRALAWTPRLAAEATLLAALASAGCWGLVRRPWLGLGILWFFITLAPTNSLLPRPDVANDRHLYLASVGLWLAVGVELALWHARLLHTGGLARLALVAVCVALATLTAVRNRDYRSEVTLWEQTARVSPAKARVFNNLGYAYAAAGRADDARAAYTTALRLDPNFRKAHDNLRVLEAMRPDGP